MMNHDEWCKDWGPIVSDGPSWTDALTSPHLPFHWKMKSM